MEDRKDFIDAFKISTASLLISGVAIQKLNYNRFANILINNWLFYFNVAWVQTDAFGELAWVVDALKNGVSIIVSSEMAPCIILCILIQAKLAPIFYNRGILRDLMTKFKEIHPMFIESASDIERKTVKESTRLIYLTGLLLRVLFTLLALAFTTAPMFLMLNQMMRTGKSDLILPYQAIYFFEPNTTFLYAIVYIHQAVATTFVCINVIGVDSTFYAFCIFVRMHFRLLSYRFENEISLEPKKPAENLIPLVLRHQELIRLVKQMEDLFSNSVLFHIVLSSVLICLCLFNMAFTDNIENNIKFSLFLTMSLTHIFQMCYFGDMLMTSSTEFSQSVYNSKWYNADIRDKRYILFILMRAQTPCKITAAGFADLTMTTFTSILSSSWSYFALLRTMVH